MFSIISCEFSLHINISFIIIFDATAIFHFARHFLLCLQEGQMLEIQFEENIDYHMKINYLDFA